MNQEEARLLGGRTCSGETSQPSAEGAGGCGLNQNLMHVSLMCDC